MQHFAHATTRPKIPLLLLVVVVAVAVFVAVVDVKQTVQNTR